MLAKCAELEYGVEQFCTVGDYCKRIYSGGTPSTTISSYWNGALPWLSSGETRARFIIDAEKTITREGVEGSSTKLANRGSIVMASAGQGFTRGQTSMLLFDTYVNQSVVVMSPKEKCGSYLLFALAARYEELRAWSDSMSTRGSMSGKVLKRFVLPYLTKEQLERFESLASPLIRTIETNLRESKSLAALRDVLLPKLMAGEIDVSRIDLVQLNSHLVECIQVINQGAVEPNLSPNLANQPFAGKLFVCCIKSVFGLIELLPVFFFSQFFNSLFTRPVKFLAICLHRIQDDLVLVDCKQKRLISINELGDYRFRLTFEHESRFHRKGPHLIELQMKPQLMLAFKYMRNSGRDFLKKSRIGQQFKA